MIYTAIDTFYLTQEQLLDSPSRKDDIDEQTENNLRLYGCELIQEGGILLKLYVTIFPPSSLLSEISFLFFYLCLFLSVCL